MIALAVSLAGCSSDSKGLLLRDLEQLAELPKKMDKVARKDVAQEQGVEPAPAMPAPVEEAALTVPAQPVPQTADAQADQQALHPEAAPTPAPAKAVETPRKAKPTVLDRLLAARAAKSEPEPELRGAYDQIPEPIPVENPLARPPWEVFMEAGPNAHNELDLETLYGPGQVPPELLAEQEAAQQQQQVAVAQEQAPLAMPPADDPPPEAAPAPEQSAKKEKKGDVVITAVAVPMVKGAKGEGNSELTAAMRNALQQAGWPVLKSPRKDALTVQGRVSFGKAHGATQSVKIVWDVLTPDGKNLGNLKQDNAIPAGSLDQAWGENAGYAADAAAEGIFKLIQKHR